MVDSQKPHESNDTAVQQMLPAINSGILVDMHIYSKLTSPRVEEKL